MHIKGGIQHICEKESLTAIVPRIQSTPMKPMIFLYDESGGYKILCVTLFYETSSDCFIFIDSHEV